MGEKVIGLAEAAALLRIPYQDAHRLVLTGRLDGRKQGGRWYVPVADVERLALDRSRARTGRHGVEDGRHGI